MSDLPSYDYIKEGEEKKYSLKKENATEIMNFINTMS